MNQAIQATIDEITDNRGSERDEISNLIEELKSLRAIGAIAPRPSNKNIAVRAYEVSNDQIVAKLRSKL